MAVHTVVVPSRGGRRLPVSVRTPGDVTRLVTRASAAIRVTRPARDRGDLPVMTMNSKRLQARSDDGWRVVDAGWGRRAVDFATLSEPANCREYVIVHHRLGVGEGIGCWMSRAAQGWRLSSPACAERSAPASTRRRGWWRSRGTGLRRRTSGLATCIRCRGPTTASQW